MRSATEAIVALAIFVAVPSAAGAETDPVRVDPLVRACQPGEGEGSWQTEPVASSALSVPATLTFGALDVDGAASAPPGAPHAPAAAPEPAVTTEQWLHVPAQADRTRAWRLSLRQTDGSKRPALFSIGVYLLRPGGASTGATREVVECFATDAASPGPDLLLPAGFEGLARVTRLDPPTFGVSAAVTLNGEPFRAADTPAASVGDVGNGWFARSVSRGHAVRMTLTAAHYDLLVSFARCEYQSQAERQPAPSAPAAPPNCAEPGEYTRQARLVYEWLSAAMGRSPEREFLHVPAAQTEPIIAFVGLANMNQTMLLDCRRIDDQACTTFSEPWQISLDRARYGWAVYLEESLTGYDTAIDIEFKRDAPELDYEEFDPRAPVQQSTVAAGTGTRPTIRVGFRRFRLREAPTAVQVAFTRQGPSYGLRQYQRVFVKRSSRAWQTGVTLLVTPKATEIRDISLVEAPRDDFELPATGRVTTEVAENWYFTGLSVRWPTVRARADDQPNWYQRLGWNAIPDITVGRSFREGDDPYFVGASWPLRFRTNFAFGMSFVRSRFLRDGFRERQLLPIDTAADVFSHRRWTKEVVIGLSLDLLDTR